MFFEAEHIYAQKSHVFQIIEATLDGRVNFIKYLKIIKDFLKSLSRLQVHELLSTRVVWSRSHFNKIEDDL